MAAAGVFQQPARLRRNNWVRLKVDRYANDEYRAEAFALGPFELSRYPVTVEEFRQFVENGSYDDSEYWNAGGFGQWQLPEDWEEQKLHPNRPVVGVNWYEAAAYCRWKGTRLPSMSEWERAAGVFSGRRYPWGYDPPHRSLLNFNGMVGHPTPVGLYPLSATPEGVLDLAGNVWEWLADGYEDEVSRVLRGGSWVEGEWSLRSAVKGRLSLLERRRDFGFRCARDVQGPVPPDSRDW